MVLDSIYLNKRGNENETWHWVYYRIRSNGKDGDPIDFCQLRWPTFEDIDVPGDLSKAVVSNPGDTGLAVAYEHTCTLLKNKWNIDHTNSVLIGIREVKS